MFTSRSSLRWLLLSFLSWPSCYLSLSWFEVISRDLRTYKLIYDFFLSFLRPSAEFFEALLLYTIRRHTALGSLIGSFHDQIRKKQITLKINFLEIDQIVFDKFNFFISKTRLLIAY